MSVVTTAAAINRIDLVKAYCVVGEFGFPAGFGAELQPLTPAAFQACR